MRFEDKQLQIPSHQQRSDFSFAGIGNIETFVLLDKKDIVHHITGAFSDITTKYPHHHIP